MPAGHNQLCLEGVHYNPDAEGAFTVPDHHAADLQRVHGAIKAPAIQDLEQGVDHLESARNQLTTQLAQVEADLVTAKEQVAAAKKAQAEMLAASAKETLARTPIDTSTSAGKGSKGSK
jgi:chromosome segregation ATPase